MVGESLEKLLGRGSLVTGESGTSFVAATRRVMTPVGVLISAWIRCRPDIQRRKKEGRKGEVQGERETRLVKQNLV